MTRISMTRLALSALVLAFAGLVGACESPAGLPDADTALTPDAPALASAKACWGQATRAFAQMGVMGEHASQQATPRLGLANLARALYEQGVIPEPTMQALGQFVTAELGLSIEACMS